MLKKSILVFFLAFSLHAISQTDIQWQKSLGGTGVDIPNVIRQTADSGYIVAGKSLSNDGDVTLHYGFSSNNDFWIVKLSKTGQKTWVKTFGGTLDDYATDIRTLSDKGYIVAGTERSGNNDVSFNHGAADFWLVKLDSMGAIKWEKTFGGTGKEDASSVEPTKDKGYIIAGSTFSKNGQVAGNHDSTGTTTDFWLVKTDSSGNFQWQKCLGGSGDDNAAIVRQTADGGYIVAGSTNSTNGDITLNKGLNDFWIVRIDSAGTPQWQKTFGGTGDDLAKSLCVLSDGGFVIAGSSTSSDGDVTGSRGGSDYWVIKIDSAGTLVWGKSFGGTVDDGASSIDQAAGGGFILAGWTWSANWDISNSMGGEDYWIVKIDSAGIMEWQKNFGGSGQEEATCIQKTFDGGYVVSGFSDSFSGDVNFNHGADDYWIIKLDPSVGIQAISADQNNVVVYPNPANEILNLKLTEKKLFYDAEIADACGKKIITQQLSDTSNASINIGGLESGVYFLTLRGEQNAVLKIIKQ